MWKTNESKLVKVVSNALWKYGIGWGRMVIYGVKYSTKSGITETRYYLTEKEAREEQKAYRNGGYIVQEELEKSYLQSH